LFSLFFRTDISIGQGSALSPILSTLYISPIFQIFEKRAKNLIPSCYNLKSLEWDKRTNSCIRVNTKELDRELFTK